jgi:flagellar basal-body rod protein FlgF
MDVIANNIANVSTSAFQREEATFQEFVVNVLPVEGQVGKQSLSLVKDKVMRRDLSDSRQLNEAGQIVTSNGDAVQGDGGPITVTPDDGDVHIAADGTVSGKTGQIGRLRVVDFENPRLLAKEGASLYATGQPTVTADNFKLQSGMLETSNVEPVIEISHMIEVMRAYQATATLTQTQEDLMRQAIDKLGSMSS